MGTLSPNQVLFVLKALGKAELYQHGEGLPGETFVESFIDEINCPMGRLASSMALKYELDYENGKVVLRTRTPPKLEEIQSQVQKVGMRIPNIYRSDVNKVMEYIENFGYLYLSFNSEHNVGNLDNWMKLTGNTHLLANTPTLRQYDPCLNIFLETHLRDLCTDFDLYDLYPQAMAKIKEFQNRKEIIDYIVKLYQPLGQFWVSFGFGNLTISHNGIKYDSIPAIKAFAAQLQPLGIYQLAFLLRPGNVKFIYGIDITKKVAAIMQDLYRYLLDLIQQFESKGILKLRFGEQFGDFNRELGA